MNVTFTLHSDKGVIIERSVIQFDDGTTVEEINEEFIKWKKDVLREIDGGWSVE